jgi:hypothetical protein
MPIAVIAWLLAAEPKIHQTPWYLPRSGAAVVFFGNGAVSPALRLGWEVDLVDQPRNNLVFGVQAGVAYSASTPQGVGLLWQYVALAGIGYRMQREIGFHWGFDIGFGPALYGNRGDTKEQRVTPYIEGRVNLGWKLRAVTLSACGGYAQWIARDPFSAVQRHIGGPFLGVLLGWK